MCSSDLRQAQDIDRAIGPLQALLVHDAEPVLLVDDEKSQVLKLDPLLQQLVRPDDDVDGPVLRARRGAPRLRPRGESGEYSHRDRKAREAGTEGSVMLLSQDRRRDQYADLAARGDGPKSRPQRNLRLAEPSRRRREGGPSERGWTGPP